MMGCKAVLRTLKEKTVQEGMDGVSGIGFARLVIHDGIGWDEAELVGEEME